MSLQQIRISQPEVKLISLAIFLSITFPSNGQVKNQQDEMNWKADQPNSAQHSQNFTQDTDNDGTIDTVLQDVSTRDGLQVRVLIDVRASGLTIKDVNAYIKYVDQGFIDASTTAGKVLTDLDGKVITQAGWYDFTQRSAGGDGARFIADADGNIQYIELIITDNAFGDNDITLNRVFDPGVPVLRIEAVASQPTIEDPGYVHPPMPPIEIPPGPNFTYSPFDSTLYALAAEANPKDWGLIERTDWQWETRSPIEGTTGDSLKWESWVVPSEVASLQVFRGMGDQFTEQGAATSFAVPSDAFVHTKMGTEVVLTAKLADGSDLPRWVRFDAQSGKFSVNPPEGFKGELKIKLIARDAQGREASTLFRFHVGEKRPTGLGRSGFSEQLRQAAQHTGYGVGAQRWAVL